MTYRPSPEQIAEMNERDREWRDVLLPALQAFARGESVFWNHLDSLVKADLIFVKKGGRTMGLTNAGKAWVGQGAMWVIEKQPNDWYGGAWRVSFATAGRLFVGTCRPSRQPYMTLGRARTYRHAVEWVSQYIQEAHDKWGETLPPIVHTLPLTKHYANGESDRVHDLP